MKMLSWNCRGLGNSRAVRALSRLSLKFHPQIVFLMETRSYVTEFDHVKIAMGMDCCLAMSCAGPGRRRSGGIAMLWNSSLDVSLLSCSPNHISVVVTDEWDQKWCLTGLYGHPEEVNKVHTLTLLDSLKSQYQGMWICIGDFNLICESSEKRGGRIANLAQMGQFKDTLAACGLADVGYTGFPFTWDNGREGDQNICERLDRCVANSEFTANFPSIIVEHLGKYGSDHSVRYAILLNGEPRDWFSPHRGLRQGDPISPYLFILCAEVFAGLIDEQVALNNIHGIRIARGAPQISHLFFADDSLLFMRANLVEANHTLASIKRYEEASGQRVNFDKTELSFSQNVQEQLCNQIRHRMEVKVVDSHDKYLGLPTIIGRSKKAVFLTVQERLVKKLKGWKEKFLSKAGKEVLLKAIAQAIPTYIMSCFKLPESVCASMASLMANFWWGQKNSEKKIHWMSWANLCKPKACGGLGFRDFRSFNDALLAKQVWRLLHREDSLLFKCLKARYFPRSSLLDAPVGFRPSFAWRSICSARPIIKDGFVWKVGNG
ncbi:uncharacterized protein LOC130748518 [Lotus japonicus]|uniref:uncharacterized protein LOC130748518 n=1 Tax=Lotus japonicus TaxID=34305 RepID=UPI00258F7AFE|nr:uncharacterized protein LOC130748518 [Lotus japonicus]